MQGQSAVNLAETLSYGCHIYRAHSRSLPDARFIASNSTGMMARSREMRAEAKKNKAFQPCFQVSRDL
ncbi:hypothetical protein FHL81_08315 [Agrobacterium tumefaciens]|nr:hypothetical protein FHL81_08315 [Agrobacterium tumefaciens]KAB0462635.1 hypothetical protein F7R04_03380 [Agrobacterium tumefaciens]TGE82543.1 hypothetical protein C9410_05950 [Rhizobium sp. SEMIA 439]